MDLDISMEDKAKEFLKKKGNTLVISRMDIDRGCSAFEDLEVTYKSPQNRNYEKHLRDEITIYIQKGLQFKDNRVEIVVSGIGPFRTIAVDGLKRSV